MRDRTVPPPVLGIPGGRTFLSVRICGEYAGQDCPASSIKYEIGVPRSVSKLESSVKEVGVKFRDGAG